MKNIFLILMLMVSSSFALAMTCGDHEEAITRKIVSQLPELSEGSIYPSLTTSFGLINNHLNDISKAVIIRGKSVKTSILMKVVFNDGSDTNLIFSVTELGSRNMKDLIWTITSVTNMNANVIHTTPVMIKKLLETKTFKRFSVSYDYFDQETELGSKIAVKFCTLEFEARLKNARKDII